jgi:hypothetical protein
MTSQPTQQLLRQVRFRIFLFILGLVFSGVTAFPMEWELRVAEQWMAEWHWDNLFSRWIERVSEGIENTNSDFPFIAYGTDWLAFAHLMIAVAFIGPLKDPVRNRWVIEFGLIACFSIFPFAFIAGYVRQIPIFWRLIDCTFGVVGGVLLLDCYRKINVLESQKKEALSFPDK